MTIPSTLYIVATPIGNLKDISQRAIETLNNVDLIAAEDTRHSALLLKAYGIQTPMMALHEHNEKERSEDLLLKLKEGTSVALISDAGTPLISDPGFYLIRRAHEEGIPVSPIPGCSALVAALSAAGLPCDRFIFEGFLPAKSAARQQYLLSLQQEERTIIFYEAPHRIVESLKDLLSVFGENATLALCREITKRFETIKVDSVKNILSFVENSADQQKGEFVLLVSPAEKEKAEIEDNIANTLKILLEELPLKQAVKLAAQLTKANKNHVYELALRLKEE